MSNRIVPIDQNGFPIQTLALGTNVYTTVTGSTQTVALPDGASHEDIVRIACDTDCHINFGDSGVTATATDPLFTAGVEAFKVPQTATHIAILRKDTDGIMTITEMI